MTTPHPPESLDDVLTRARAARDRLEVAQDEWRQARDALNRVIESGQLPADRRSEVQELLAGEEQPHHRARWRPAPS